MSRIYVKTEAEKNMLTRCSIYGTNQARLRSGGSVPASFAQLAYPPRPHTPPRPHPTPPQHPKRKTGKFTLGVYEVAESDSERCRRLHHVAGAWLKLVSSRDQGPEPRAHLKDFS